jgi:hypothetical protein
MDFDLITLFEDPGTSSITTEQMACDVTSEWAASKDEDSSADSDDLGDLMGSVQLMLDGKMSGLLEDQVVELTQERDHWKAQAETCAVRIDVLEKRIASKLASVGPVDSDVVARLNRLEQENRQLKSKNLNLEEELRELKTEKTLLCDDNEGKSRKLRGAHKKVMNAKDVAKKEKEKADEALHQKKLRLESEREMRKKMKAEEAKVADCEKKIASLQSKLYAETSGYPHVRDDGTTTDEAIVAFAVQFKIHRQHFQKLRGMLEHNQMAMTDKLVVWYDQ